MVGWSWRLVASVDHQGSAVPSPNIPPCSTLPGLSVMLFLILGLFLTPDPRCCWKPLCLVGRTPQPDSVPCPAAAGVDHFSTEPQKQKQVLLPWLRMQKPHTAALQLLLGWISQEKSLLLGPGLFWRGGPSWTCPTSALWLCGPTPPWTSGLAPLTSAFLPTMGFGFM